MTRLIARKNPCLIGFDVIRVLPASDEIPYRNGNIPLLVETSKSQELLSGEGWFLFVR